jgi:hypothetical protein
MPCPICREESGHLSGYACADQIGPVVCEMPRRPPPSRICEGCGASLRDQPHDVRCPTLVQVKRLATDHEGRRAEDALERCNIAGQLWLRERARRAA